MFSLAFVLTIQLIKGAFFSNCMLLYTVNRLLVSVLYYYVIININIISVFLYKNCVSPHSFTKSFIKWH